MITRLLVSTLAAALAISTAAPLRSQAPCTTDSIDISTGYNPWTGSALGIGVPDPLWLVTSDPLPGTTDPHLAVTISPFASWDAAFAGTRWISTLGAATNPTNGLYVFQRCFCVETFIKKAHIVMDLLVDDQAVVILNGDTIASTAATPGSDYANPTHIDVVVSLSPGMQCLEVHVQNTGAVAMGTMSIATAYSMLGAQRPTLVLAAGRLR